MEASLKAFSEEPRELLENREDTLLQLEAHPGDDDLTSEWARNGQFKVLLDVEWVLSIPKCRWLARSSRLAKSLSIKIVLKTGDSMGVVTNASWMVSGRPVADKPAPKFE